MRLTESDINAKIFAHLHRETNGWQGGKGVIALQGGRRSGKTYTIMQSSLLTSYNYGDEWIVASMTADQGKAGAYDDARAILRSEAFGWMAPYMQVLKSPREINCRFARNNRQGHISFRSFADPETAKGGACDWVFINEANKFTYQQYLDLKANARKGVILDYNPQVRFWVDDLDVVPLQTTWRDNIEHLTDVQLQYFRDLKAAVERPNATSADWYYYNVYYLGNYAELSGGVFSSANIRLHPLEERPRHLHDFIVYSDPSALRGGDYFASVFCALDENNDMWVLDVASVNEGTPEERIEWMRERGASADGVRIFCETYGMVGTDFFIKATDAGLPMEYWNDNKNKFERIVANYQDITRRVHFLEGPMMKPFLEQVYSFGKKCDHDDNIDAVNSALKIYKFNGLIV